MSEFKKDKNDDESEIAQITTAALEAYHKRRSPETQYDTRRWKHLYPEGKPITMPYAPWP